MAVEVGDAVGVDLGDGKEVVGIMQKRNVDVGGETKDKIWYPDPASDGAGRVDVFAHREKSDGGGGRTWYTL